MSTSSPTPSPAPVGATYAVVPLTHDVPLTLGKRISELADQGLILLHKSYEPKAWFVWYAGTPKELSDAIGLNEGDKGVAIVMSVTSYYGFASRDLWDWLALYV